MNYIVLDLEATCEKDNPHFNKEIIEIGAVKLTDSFEIIDTYDAFVRPILNPTLSAFCMELTTIQQSDVDAANLFPVVLNGFKEWIGVGSKEYLLCSWGFYDKKQLNADCRLHQLNDSWTDRHISLKHQFADIRDCRPCGMEKALKILNIPLDGTHHRGIDDAKNIAKIFKVYKDRWDFPAELRWRW